MLDFPYCRHLIANSKRTTTLPITYVLSYRRKGWRARHVNLHNRVTRALASSNRQILSHTFSPRAQATPPPVVGLIYNRGPAAAASLNIVITVTTRIERVA